MKREDLRHDFLKNIIIRCDFKGIVEGELDKIMPDIKAVVKEFDFNEMNEKTATELDFQLNDPELEVQDMVSVKEIRKTKIYSFGKNDKAFMLDISNKFVCLNVRAEVYTNFDEYKEIICSILTLMKTRLDYFMPIRFGVRKINCCFVKDILKIGDYFNKDYFSVTPVANIDEYKVSVKNDSFSIEGYNVNLQRHVVKGIKISDEVYQLILDIDVYTVNNDQIEEIIDNKTNAIGKMNNIIFDLFSNSLTETFYSRLCDSEFIDTNIEGVRADGHVQA